MKKTIITLILLICLLLSACTNTTGNITEKNSDTTIKIGMDIELTGFGAYSGENVRNGADLAVKEINANGGIDGKKIELIYEDSKSSAQGTVSAVNKLINYDNVDILITGYTPEMQAVIPIAEANKIPVISVSAGGLDIGILSKYAFRTWPADKVEAGGIANFAINKLNYDTAAIVYTQGPWEDGLRIPFRNEFEKNGGTIVYEAGQSDIDDWRTILLKAKLEEPDVIYLAVHSGAIVNVLNQIEELGIDSQVLYTSYSEDPVIMENAKTAVEGLIYPKYTDSQKWFVDKYQTEYSEKPGVSADIAYDTMYIIANIIKEQGTGSDNILKGLNKVKNYNGASGTITIDENGDRVDRDLIIKTVKDGKYEIYNNS